jgi:hypothetical protein
VRCSKIVLKACNLMGDLPASLSELSHIVYVRADVPALLLASPASAVVCAVAWRTADTWI